MQFDEGWFLCYHLFEWGGRCSDLIYLPVKPKIAGSNPVAPVVSIPRVLDFPVRFVRQGERTNANT